jgi:hypothetical protein
MYPNIPCFFIEWQEDPSIMDERSPHRRNYTVRHRISLVAAAASVAGLAGLASAQSSYIFQSLNLPAGTDGTQVRDAAVGLAVGYVIRPDPSHPYFAHLDATAWRLDGSGSFINLHRIPPNLPPGVNLLTTEALGVDDLHQIGGAADRLSSGTVGDDEGAYWANPQAFPFGLSAQVGPQLTSSSILDVDGRWAVGEGRRLTGPDAINDRAWAWDVTSGARRDLLGPNGETLTYASEIEGRRVIGHRQFTIDEGGTFVNYWRPMAWDLGDGADSGDLSGLTASELNNGGRQYAYLNGVNETGLMGVGQGSVADGQPFHALSWDLSDPTAAPRDLHSLVPAQFERSSASDAMGSLVVGSLADDADLSVLRAAAWDVATNTFIDLHSFLPADVVHSSGTAINRSGQIVGDFWLADGTRGVFVLTPDFDPGDSTGDGVPDVLDLQILANNYDQAGRSFYEGDITLDGSAGFADLVLMSQVYTPTENTVPGLHPFATFEEARVFFNLPAVPEPSMLGLLGMGALLLLRRR